MPLLIGSEEITLAMNYESALQNIERTNSIEMLEDEDIDIRKENIVIFKQRETVFIEDINNSKIKYIGSYHIDNCIFLKLTSGNKAFFAHVDSFSTNIDWNYIVYELFKNSNDIELELLGGIEENSTAKYNLYKLIIANLIAALSDHKPNISISKSCVLRRNMHESGSSAKI